MGVAGFLGSHLAEHLLSKGIQVIGVDNLSTGIRKNLENLSKDKHFHLINQSIDDPVFFKEVLSQLNLPRLDYAFFVAGFNNQELTFSHGMMNFLGFVKNTKENLKDHEKDKPRVVFVSSIDLYSKRHDNDFSDEYTKELAELKEGEVRFAKYVRYHKLNGRVVRLAPVIGPRMHFVVDDPIVKLIQASLTDKLNSQNTSLDLATRAIYVDDAVNLIVKTVLLGSTSQKIYDGALLNPVKVAEIKQILLDPVWHEVKNFIPSELPPWPTPNLQRTMKELSWDVKTTIVAALKHTITYFKDHEIKVESFKEEEVSRFTKKWSFANTEVEGEEVKQEVKAPKLRKQWHSKLPVFLALVVILLGVVLPLGSLVYEGLGVRNHLKNALENISKAEFDQARSEVKQASNAVSDGINVLGSIAFLKGVGLDSQINSFEYLLKTSKEGIDGVEKAVNGSEELYKARQVISGELDTSPLPFYESSQADLTSASQKLSKVQANLEDMRYTPFIQSKVDDLKLRLKLVSELVDKARSASFLLPHITAVDGKRVYLVLLQDNLELKGAGGAVKSYAKLTFEKGKITSVVVEDGDVVDKKLQQTIDAPAELVSDTGSESLSFKNSTYEADYPTTAKTAQLFLRRSGGEATQGVFALDLVGTSYLVKALGGDEDLLSQYIKSPSGFITSTNTALFNKLFYLSKQNWPAVVEAMNRALEEKHLLVYLSDPSLFAYAASENWSGILPRGVSEKEGFTNDFLAVVDSNISSNNANYYLDRGINLETKIDKNYIVSQKLRVSYKLSPDVTGFKNRVRVYLPLGSKLIKASYSEVDITSNITSFTEYGRAVYSTVLSLSTGEQKILNLEYQLNKPLSFKEDRVLYKLDIFKQPGSKNDSLEWNIKYPISLRAESALSKSRNSDQEISLTTELNKDRSMQINFSK